MKRAIPKKTHTQTQKSTKTIFMRRSAKRQSEMLLHLDGANQIYLIEQKKNSVESRTIISNKTNDC